ncbi:MAG: phosphoenolpyruvate-utilizing N-terminal domain-containing protein, partial [Phycisphaerae bacterium]
MTTNGNNQETEEGNRSRNRHLTGSAIAPGLAEGKAFVYRDILSQDESTVPMSPSQINVEHARLDEARETVLKELAASRRRVEAQMTSSLADIFRAHDAMLRDPVLLQEVTEEIEGGLIHVEEAIRRVFGRWVERFRANGSTAKAGRAEDVADLARRLLRALRGIRAHPLEEMPDGSVLVAQRLAP